MRSTIIVRAALCCLVAWSATSAGPATTRSASRDVSIDNFAFDPPVLTVPAGTTVRWANHDDVPHTVTSEGKPRTLNSKAIDTDQTFEFTFAKAGEYPYFCAIHPHMRGRVVVK